MNNSHVTEQTATYNIGNTHYEVNRTFQDNKKLKELILENIIGKKEESQN